MKNYILEGKTPKPVGSILEWVKWFETADRIVKSTMVNGIHISTVFLGIDHSFYGDGAELFETMIFGGNEDGYQTRCATWREAENQHQKAINIVNGDNFLAELKQS